MRSNTAPLFAPHLAKPLDLRTATRRYKLLSRVVRTTNPFAPDRDESQLPALAALAALTLLALLGS